MAQLTHVQNMTKAVPGHIADMGKRDSIACIATEDIAFGLFVVASGAKENPYTAKLPTLTAEITDGRQLGVAVRDGTVEFTGNGHANLCPFAAFRCGRIWVTVEDTVSSVGTPAFVRHAAGAGGTQLGAFRTDADTATATALAGAKYMTTTTGAGQLALLQIDI